MKEKMRNMGISAIGSVPWGTHLCQFYRTKEDLIDILVPYFKAGLENNEFCMWVTSEPLSEKEAKEVMRKALPQFDEFLKKGRIEIIPFNEWYIKEGAFNAKRVLKAWVDKLEKALSKNFDGMRLTGNTFWLEKENWKSFADYEEEMNSVIGTYKMIAICTYHLDRCGASEIIDVVSNHQFALIRQEGKWELIESSERKKTEESLKNSAREWRATLNAVNDSVFLTDLEGRVLRCNRAMGKLLRKSSSEIIGRTCRKLLHCTLEPIEDCPLRRMAKSSRRERGVLSIGEHYFETTVDPVRDKDGALRGAVHIMTDITEQRKARQEVESLSRFPSENPSPVLRVGTDGKVLYANDAAKRILEVRVEKKVPERYLPIIKKATESQQEIGLEEKLDSLYYTSVFRFIPEAGYINIYSSEVTQQKKAEEALRQSEAEYEDLYKSAPVAYYSVGVDGYIKRANRAAENLSGYRLEELKKMKVFDLYSEESRAKGKELFERMKQGFGWENEEMAYKVKKGQKVYGFLSVSPVKDEDGQVKESRSVVIDITQRKKAEEKLERNREMLKASERSLREFSRRVLSVREEEKRKLAANLHDAVGSLAVDLSSRLGIIEREVKDGNLQGALERLQQIKRTVKQEVRALKKIAREVRPPDLDIVGLPGALRTHFSNITKEARIKIDFSTSVDRERISDDAAIVLYRTAQEALSNVINHANAKKVKVRLYSQYCTIKLNICDDGKGFDVKKFLGGTKVKGIGLRGMQERAESLNGRFTIKSTPKEGTEIMVTLSITSKQR